MILFAAAAAVMLAALVMLVLIAHRLVRKVLKALNPAWLWFSGHCMDGQSRTNATWTMRSHGPRPVLHSSGHAVAWHHLPRMHRAGIRSGATHAFLAGPVRPPDGLHDHLGLPCRRRYGAAAGGHLARHLPCPQLEARTPLRPPARADPRQQAPRRALVYRSRARRRRSEVGGDRMAARNRDRRDREAAGARGRHHPPRHRGPRRRVEAEGPQQVRGVHAE